MPVSSVNVQLPTVAVRLARICKAAEKNSNCARGEVGCVLGDNDGRVLAVTWNGSIFPHGCQRSDEMGNCGCLHAEVRAAMMLRESHAYYAIVSRAPCERCAKVLAEIGVRRVYYFEPSRPQAEGFAIFERAAIEYGRTIAPE